MPKQKEVNSKLKLEDIIYNEPEEIDVPELDCKITVKLPTVGQKLQIRKEATQLPGWNVLTEEEQRAEMTKLMATKMLVDPKVTLKEYLESSDLKMLFLVEAVSRYYVDKLKEVSDKKKEVDTFLGQQTES